MKIVCFILSIYVLVLSTVPCCSDDNCIDETKTEQADKHPQKEHQGCEGSCSPFLTCGTCVGFTFSNFTISFEPSKVSVQNVSLKPSYKSIL
jgi:hypothetical protein